MDRVRPGGSNGIAVLVVHVGERRSPWQRAPAGPAWRGKAGGGCVEDHGEPGAQHDHGAHDRHGDEGEEERVLDRSRPRSPTGLSAAARGTVSMSPPLVVARCEWCRKDPTLLIENSVHATSSPPFEAEGRGVPTYEHGHRARPRCRTVRRCTHPVQPTGRHPRSTERRSARRARTHGPRVAIEVLDVHAHPGLRRRARRAVRRGVVEIGSAVAHPRPPGSRLELSSLTAKSSGQHPHRGSSSSRGATSAHHVFRPVASTRRPGPRRARAGSRPPGPAAPGGAARSSASSTGSSMATHW